MARRLAFLIYALFFLICYTEAQEIKIRVIDDSDGQPVPFCHICCENKETGKQEYHVGDINGEATVALAENVILSVSAMGYENYLESTPGAKELFEFVLNPVISGLMRW